MTVTKKITELRTAIDDLDVKLVEILNKRARHAIDIGNLKKKYKLPVYDPEREDEILERVKKYNNGPLTADAMQRLFERIIDESRRLERDSAGNTHKIQDNTSKK